MLGNSTLSALYQFGCIRVHKGQQTLLYFFLIKKTNKISNHLHDLLSTAKILYTPSRNN